MSSERNFDIKNKSSEPKLETTFNKIKRRYHTQPFVIPMMNKYSDKINFICMDDEAETKKEFLLNEILEDTKYLYENNLESPDMYDYRGKTALHVATTKNLINFMKIIIAFGADVNMISLGKGYYQEKCGYTPLHYSAMHHNIDTMRLLIKNEADPNIKDSRGNNTFKWINTELECEILMSR